MKTIIRIRKGIALLATLIGLLFASPARAGDDKISAYAARARDIANRMQAALDPDQCQSVTSCKVTVGVAILDNGKVLVATSEKDRGLRSPLRAIADAEDAEVVRGSGDAEEKIINYVRGSLFYYRDRKILVVAAGRPICEKCERMILDAGARPASPCKSGRRY